MSEPHDEEQAPTTEDEWSQLLGQTSAFLGRMQEIVQETPEEELTPTPERPAEEEVDLVAAFPRTLGEIVVSYEISGRALARARATYGEPLSTCLRLLGFAGTEPEVLTEDPIELPGKGVREYTLPQKVAFVLAAVGVLSPRGEFYPLAHATPLALQPAALYPKSPVPALWLDKRPPRAQTTGPEPKAPLLTPPILPEEEEEETTPLPSSRF